MAKVKIHSPLDTGHSPFKRMATLGPGPRRRPAIKVQDRYVCKKGKSVTKDGVKFYVQNCKDSVTGKVRKIKTNSEWKQEYNSAYNKKRTRSAASNTYRAGFKPRAGTKLYEAGQKALSRRK